MSYLALLGVPAPYQAIGDVPADITLPDLSGGRWVFLFGPAGCGKTHRAVEILHAHFSRVGFPRPVTWRPWHHTRRPGAGPRFVDWPCYLDGRRRSFAPEASRETVADESSWLLLDNPEMVILDDVGSERPTDFAIDSLNVTISSRYNRRPLSPTIITSNLRLDGIAAVYGDRIASRIMEMSVVADQGGTDWRAAIARASC